MGHWKLVLISIRQSKIELRQSQATFVFKLLIAGNTFFQQRSCKSIAPLTNSQFSCHTQCLGKSQRASASRRKGKRSFQKGLSLIKRTTRYPVPLEGCAQANSQISFFSLNEKIERCMQIS